MNIKTIMKQTLSALPPFLFWWRKENDKINEELKLQPDNCLLVKTKGENKLTLGKLSAEDLTVGTLRADKLTVSNNSPDEFQEITDQYNTEPEEIEEPFMKIPGFNIRRDLLVIPKNLDANTLDSKSRNILEELEKLGRVIRLEFIHRAAYVRT